MTVPTGLEVISSYFYLIFIPFFEWEPSFNAQSPLEQNAFIVAGKH